MASDILILYHSLNAITQSAPTVICYIQSHVPSNEMAFRLVCSLFLKSTSTFKPRAVNSSCNDGVAIMVYGVLQSIAY